MGDTYVEFSDAISSGLDTIVPGDYIMVKTQPRRSTIHNQAGAESSGTVAKTSLLLRSKPASNETRRVLAVDNTAGYRRIYVDDPFNFDHTKVLM